MSQTDWEKLLACPGRLWEDINLAKYCLPLKWGRNCRTLGVSLNYLMGNTDIELDKNILDKVAIQKLADEGKTHIMYSLDGPIQHAKTRLAYK